MIETLNLALRFFLELAALVAMGYWGWTAHDGPARWLWTIGVPFVAAVGWGVFRVPGDGGDPVVTVPGQVRLLIEAAVFGGAVWLLALAGQQEAAIAFGIVIVVHYAIAYERTIALLTGRPLG